MGQKDTNHRCIKSKHTTWSDNRSPVDLVQMLILAAHWLMMNLGETHSHEFIDRHHPECAVAMEAQRLTSRTSVGVLDWACCSMALLPARLDPVSLLSWWQSLRLLARTLSICSWQARRQSCNTDTQSNDHTDSTWAIHTHTHKL